MQLALDSFGQLNLAVNAAGAAAVRPLVDTEDIFRPSPRHQRENRLFAMKFEIPSMRTGGAIVNVSSRAGLVGIPTGSIIVHPNMPSADGRNWPGRAIRHGIARSGITHRLRSLGAWIQ
jgi:NAD(P)-dependent dehydrogenase (short-subunit alcohol dehydrogenase family)